MNLMKKTVLAACAAALLLSIGTSSAVALRSLEFSPSAFSLLGELTIEEGLIRVTCEVNAALRLANRNVAKREAVVGRATWTVLEQEEGERHERCAEQRARFLPFEAEVAYLSFNGRLPEITGINIAFGRIRIVTNIGNGLAKCLINADVLGTQAINAGILGTFTIGMVFIREVTTIVGTCPRPEAVRIRGSLSLSAPRTVTVRLV